MCPLRPAQEGPDELIESSDDYTDDDDRFEELAEARSSLREDPEVGPARTLTDDCFMTQISLSILLAAAIGLEKACRFERTTSNKSCGDAALVLFPQALDCLLSHSGTVGMDVSLQRAAICRTQLMLPTGQWRTQQRTSCARRP